MHSKCAKSEYAQQVIVYICLYWPADFPTANTLLQVLKKIQRFYSTALSLTISANINLKALMSSHIFGIFSITLQNVCILHYFQTFYVVISILCADFQADTFVKNGKKIIPVYCAFKLNAGKKRNNTLEST